jgi:hypothetical protein
MRNKVIAGLFIASICLSVNVQGKAKISTSVSGERQFVIYNGMMTSSRYQNLSDDKKSLYVAGLLDGMLLAPFFRYENENDLKN